MKPLHGKPLLSRQEVQDRAISARVAKHAEQKASKPKAKYKTAGGRHSDPEKLAWLRTRKCLVAENPRLHMVYRAAYPSMWYEGTYGMMQTPCGGRVEAHHHRERGSRARDRMTVPLCTAHHTGAPDSLHTLGRRGFEVFHRLSLKSECDRYDRLRSEGATQ